MPGYSVPCQKCSGSIRPPTVPSPSVSVAVKSHPLFRTKNIDNNIHVYLCAYGLSESGLVINGVVMTNDNLLVFLSNKEYSSH